MTNLYLFDNIIIGGNMNIRKIAYGLLVLSLVLIISGSFSSFLIGLRKDKENTLNLMKVVDDEFETFSANTSVFESFREDSEGDNTYNWGANICNDLNMNYRKDCGIILFMVHLYGDIRGGYSDYFAVKFDRSDELYYLDSITQTKDINDRYVADINLFREGYTVYDTETQDDIGEFYELEVSDLLKSIA